MTLRRTRLPGSRRVLATLALAALVAGCSPMVSQRGNEPDPELLSNIEPGAATRNEVANALGSPSSVGDFNGETWYYISRRTERLAFYAPDVVEQQVVAIAFDESGVVKSVRRYDLDDAREIEIVGRETPTSGKKLGFLEQIVGNFGRFAGESEGE